MPPKKRWYSNMFANLGTQKPEPVPDAPEFTVEELLAKNAEVAKQLYAFSERSARQRDLLADRDRTIAELREVLAFYASSKHWRPITLLRTVAAIDDGGRRARKALGP